MTLRLVIDAPYPAPLLNINRLKGQTRYLDPLVRPWKQLGALLAHGKPTVPGPVIITATFRFPDNRVRDSSNLFPTVKALVDGAVLAGALAKDDDRHVISTRMDREWPNGPGRIVLTVESVAQDADSRPLRAPQTRQTASDVESGAPTAPRATQTPRADTAFRRAQNGAQRRRQG